MRYNTGLSGHAVGFLATKLNNDCGNENLYVRADFTYITTGHTIEVFWQACDIPCNVP